MSKTVGHLEFRHWTFYWELEIGYWKLIPIFGVPTRDDADVLQAACPERRLHCR